ncbi:MAG: VWA domain-containing protein [Treponema sp.]|jgi:hypothetical protein|nr:VWA domain-containing protein [Treponema sp.]
MSQKRVPLAGVLVFLAATGLWGQDLVIDADDLRVEQRLDGGFHLFIRKKPDVASVLLTETTRDPELQDANYAYRAPRWNSVNGDEIRLLDGMPLPRESRLYSLIDSTVESHPELGDVFHLYIPYILNYGYSYTRHGEVYVVDGTYLNIRAFSLPYGDYRGAFRDNPFVLKVTQRPLEGPPETRYMRDTVDAFAEIARLGRGSLAYAAGPQDLVEKIKGILDKERDKIVDVVICLDTTASMKDDIDGVRALLIPMLQEIVGEFREFRIGMVLYKDYFEEYLTKVVPFTREFQSFQRTLNAVRTGGGKDIPEAVFEALYDAASRFPWEGESRLVILVGDAPPHPRPRGKITQAMVDKAAEERNLRIHAIILPQ